MEWTWKSKSETQEKGKSKNETQAKEGMEETSTSLGVSSLQLPPGQKCVKDL